MRYDHAFLVALVRQRWGQERERGWYNPSDELALNLDALTPDDLIALGKCIRSRLDSRSPTTTLPRGWFWIALWQARSAVFGTTSCYHDPALAIREAKRRMPPSRPERPLVQGELFADDDDPPPRPGEYLVPDGTRSERCATCGAPVVVISGHDDMMLTLSVRSIVRRAGQRFALPHHNECCPLRTR